jgi:predicted amidohydrolase
MSDALKIALAQMAVQKGNVAANIQKHLQMIEVAHKHDSDFIAFPELSLTGYEPALAGALAFDLADHRLNPLFEACRQKNISVIAGAPIKHGNHLVLGDFILFPDGTSAVYSKRYLHSGEELYFVPHDWNPLLIRKGEILSLAICADINNPLHAKTAFENHSTVYLASVLLSLNGHSGDVAMLKNYAREYNMTVMAANYCGFTGGYEAAGGSLVINPGGDTIDNLSQTREGVLVARREDPQTWSCSVVEINR